MGDNYHHGNMAVIEADLRRAEKHIGEFFELHRGQAEVNHSLQGTLELLSQSLKHHVEKTDQHISKSEPKLERLWDLRNEVGGSWSALKIIGTVFASGIGILGTAAVLVKMIR